MLAFVKAKGFASKVMKSGRIKMHFRKLKYYACRSIACYTVLLIIEFHVVLIGFSTGLPRCRIRLKHVLIMIALLLFIYFLHLHQSLASIRASLITQSRPAERNKLKSNKIILYWTSFFEWPDYGFGFGREAFINHKCRENRCETTNDRSRIKEADAVVFHIRNLNVVDLPTVRYDDQRWIFYLFEQPLLTWLNLKPLGNVFNWTMTYRRDSDILMMEYITKPRSEIEQTTANGSKNYAAGKTKQAAWLVSNCYHAFSHRDRYVTDLKKYIDVDVIGRCGRELPGCYPRLNGGNDYDNCYKVLEKDFKFYLSFENSVCADYVTEKWGNVVHYDMIPIVMGGANYEQFAPPHSYINVKDFNTPRQLAEYLKVLDVNDTLYNEYFQWKSFYDVGQRSIPFCDLCEKLHDSFQPPKTYPDIHKWWMEDGNCSNVFDLPRNELSVFTKYFDYLLDTVIFSVGSFVFSILTRLWF